MKQDMLNLMTHPILKKFPGGGGSIVFILTGLMGNKYGKTVVSSSVDSTESDVNCSDKTKKRSLYSQRDVFSNTDILHALARLDSRSVPKPEFFDTQSGQPFEQFLQTFEDYCHHNFRGSTHIFMDWRVGTTIAG